MSDNVPDPETIPITLTELVAAYGFDYLMSELVRLKDDTALFPASDKPDERWADPTWSSLWYRACERLSPIATEVLEEFSALKALHGIKD